MKTGWIIAVCGTLSIISGYQTYMVSRDNQRLSLVNSIYSAENRILKDEIANLEKKPDYEQGYKDALIRIGGPQNPGAYQDGWDAALKVAGDGSYATGYHTAIQQFGYQKPSSSTRWLVANE